MIIIVTLTTSIRNRYFPVSRFSDEYHVIGRHSYRMVTFSEDEQSEEDESYFSQTESETQITANATDGRPDNLACSSDVQGPNSSPKILCNINKMDVLTSNC